MRMGFCSDLHLNHCHDQERDAFVVEVFNADLDVLLVAGDIGVASQFDRWLSYTLGIAQRTFFVLGNHDFYGASISSLMLNAAKNYPDTYLTSMALPVELTQRACLIGEDCWGDMTRGNENSHVMLADDSFIRDFAQGQNIDLRKALGRVAAARLGAKLSTAISMGYEKIYILTHVPVFREASLYNSKISDDDYAPFFVCGQAGVVIRELTLSGPEIIVLSGHSHHKADVQIESNIQCIVCEADYGTPKLFKIWEEED